MTDILYEAATSVLVKRKHEVWVKVSVSGTYAIARVSGKTQEEARVIAKRIVDCVNFCEGMDIL